MGPLVERARQWLSNFMETAPTEQRTWEFIALAGKNAGHAVPTLVRARKKYCQRAPSSWPPIWEMAPAPLQTQKSRQPAAADNLGLLLVEARRFNDNVAAALESHCAAMHEIARVVESIGYNSFNIPRIG